MIYLKELYAKFITWLTKWIISKLKSDDSDTVQTSRGHSYYTPPDSNYMVDMRAPTSRQSQVQDRTTVKNNKDYIPIMKSNKVLNPNYLSTKDVIERTTPHPATKSDTVTRPSVNSKSKLVPVIPTTTSSVDFKQLTARISRLAVSLASDVEHNQTSITLEDNKVYTSSISTVNSNLKEGCELICTPSTQTNRKLSESPKPYYKDYINKLKPRVCSPQLLTGQSEVTTQSSNNGIQLDVNTITLSDGYSTGTHANQQSLCVRESPKLSKDDSQHQVSKLTHCDLNSQIPHANGKKLEMTSDVISRDNTLLSSVTKLRSLVSDIDFPACLEVIKSRDSQGSIAFLDLLEESVSSITEVKCISGRDALKLSCVSVEAFDDEEDFDLEGFNLDDYYDPIDLGPEWFEPEPESLDTTVEYKPAKSKRIDLPPESRVNVIRAENCNIYILKDTKEIVIGDIGGEFQIDRFSEDDIAEVAISSGIVPLCKSYFIRKIDNTSVEFHITILKMNEISILNTKFGHSQ